MNKINSIRKLQSPEAALLKGELLKLMIEKDTIARTIKFLNVCKNSEKFLYEILEDTEYKIDNGANLIAGNNYLDSRKIMEQITDNTRYFFEFSDIARFSINQAVESKDSRFCYNSILDYSEEITEVERKYKSTLETRVKNLLKEFENIEADFLIDMYLEHKNNIDKKQDVYNQ